MPLLDWREENVSAQTLASLEAEVDRAFPAREIYQDPSWLEAIRNPRDEQLVVWTLRDGGRLSGLAPLHVYPSSLQFHLGEVEIAKRRVRRYALERGPLTAENQPPEAAVACLKALSHRLPADGVVFLRGVPETSALHAELNSRRSRLRSAFYVVPHGPRYRRCRIAWSGSFDAYLASLGKVSRKDLRRTLKNVDAELGPRLVFERYSGSEGFAAFLPRAVEVSTKTYQARLLGIGIGTSESTKREAEIAAGRGAFHGFVLSIDGHPAAFDYGFRFGRAFYLVEGGYDPAWSKLQIGSYNVLRMLKSFDEQKLAVDTLDYLYGDNTHKVRTSNDHKWERHYYLLKKTSANAVWSAAMTTTDSLSRGAGALLERYGVKDIVKRLIRRRA